MPPKRSRCRFIDDAASDEDDEEEGEDIENSEDEGEEDEEEEDDLDGFVVNDEEEEEEGDDQEEGFVNWRMSNRERKKAQRRARDAKIEERMRKQDNGDALMTLKEWNRMKRSVREEMELEEERENIVRDLYEKEEDGGKEKRVAPSRPRRARRVVVDEEEEEPPLSSPKIAEAPPAPAVHATRAQVKRNASIVSSSTDDERRSTGSITPGTPIPPSALLSPRPPPPSPAAPTAPVVTKGGFKIPNPAERRAPSSRASTRVFVQTAPLRPAVAASAAPASGAAAAAVPQAQQWNFLMPPARKAEAAPKPQAAKKPRAKAAAPPQSRASDAPPLARYLMRPTGLHRLNDRGEWVPSDGVDSI